MFSIPLLVVPLALWAYLYVKTRKSASPRILKLINTLGSTIVVMGLSAFILFKIGLSGNLMMGLLMLLSLGWAIYFYFFWKSKTNDTK